MGGVGLAWLGDCCLLGLQGGAGACSQQGHTNQKTEHYLVCMLYAPLLETPASAFFFPCRAKLSDMGLSKRLVPEQVSFESVGSGGSSGWQAPEQLIGRSDGTARQTNSGEQFPALELA